MRVTEASELLGASYQLYRNMKTNETIIRTVGYSLPEVLHRHVQTVMPATCFSPRANLPRLRYLYIDTYHVRSSTVAPAVALITAHAPNLATLHVSDILLMLGCAAVLARMLCCLPLRDPYGWAISESVLDNIALLPFSVREFTLQVRNRQLTFVPELVLIEVMASMDYSDGFVLLPPTPRREYRHWKEGWLA